MTIEQIYSIFSFSEGICTDSRNVLANQLFIALSGDRFNGNLYAEEALKKGCSYAIVDDPGTVKNEKYIVVDNCLKCLQDLAKFHRQTLRIPVIAITGSNGKTTTKELANSILNKKYKVHSTQGNLNNHIGVPLTLLSMKEPEMAIIEMGANHEGEIRKLCEIADPDFGIITNIGKAHLEGFGSFEGIIKAKSELYRYLHDKEAIVFINGENSILTELTDELKLEKISYFSGEKLQCDGYVINSNEYLEIGVHFTSGNNWKTQTNLSGKYNLENILAAAAIGKYFGIEEKDIIDAIHDYIPDNNRSQIIKTDNNTVILDAYNANPTSMKEALENLAIMTAENKMIILGDMRELGKYSQDEHFKILNMLKDMNFDKVFLVGPEFKQCQKDFNFDFFTKTEELTKQLSKIIIKGHLVLLKASRTIQLEKVVELL